MTIQDVLDKKELPKTEVEILLAFVLGKDRSFITAFPETSLSEKQGQQITDLLKRRANNEPIAYLQGFREFYGRKFLVNSDVLIPRPETEQLIDQAIKIATGRKLVIADIGTGSGCIAVTLAKELPNAVVLASDVDKAALVVAKKNAILHKVDDRIKFIQSDLLENIDEPIDLIVTNLPYITTAKWNILPSEIKEFEPRLALDSGESKLSFYERLFSQVAAKLKPEAKIIYEVSGEIFER